MKPDDTDRAAFQRRNAMRLGRVLSLEVLVVIAVFIALVIVLLTWLARPRLASGPLLQVLAPNRSAVVWSVSNAGRAVSAATLVWWQSDGVRHSTAATQGALSYFSAEVEPTAQAEDVQYELWSPGFLAMPRKVAGPFTLASRDADVRRAAKRLGRPANPPAPPDTWRFLAFGDSGMGNEPQFALARGLVRARGDLIIHTGDLIYPGGEPWHYAPRFFEPYRALLRQAPFMPSLGNHDCGQLRGFPFRNVFTLPRNGPPGVESERFYWFDFADARFVAIDSNMNDEDRQGVVASAQFGTVVAPWLRRVFSQDAPRWKFAFFHHPPYTGSKHRAESHLHITQHLVPVFDEVGVNAVFCGHNHLYERTAPLRAGMPVAPSEGTVYITTGAGGATLYEEALPAPAYVQVYHDKTYSFTAVDVASDQLTITQISTDGKVLDQFTLPARPPRR